MIYINFMYVWKTLGTAHNVVEMGLDEGISCFCVLWKYQSYKDMIDDTVSNPSHIYEKFYM